MDDLDDLRKEFDRLLRVAYKRGWDGAVAAIAKAAAQSGLPEEQVAPPQNTTDEPSKHDVPVIDVILAIITERPGLRGADILREAVHRVPGSTFETMDRTGRTALGRLKKRGKIHQRQKKWYPVRNAEGDSEKNKAPAVGSLAL